MKGRRARVALVSSYWPSHEEPYRGQTAYQILKRLTEWADIAAFVPVPAYPSWLQPRTFRSSHSGTQHPLPGVTSQYFEYPALVGLGRLWNGRLVEGKLREAVTAYRPDILLNYWLYPDGWAAVRIGHRLGIPVVLGSIGSDVRLIRDQATRMYTRQALRGSAGLIAVSEDLRRGAIELGARADRSVTIRNGCDPAMFHLRSRVEARAQLGIASETELILFVGNLLVTKGLNELWGAFQALAGSRPRLEVAILGEGAWKIPGASQNNRFRLLGRASAEQVALWMAAATVFCLPSYSEGCPNVVVEALACGRPVVGTNVGGIPDLVRSGFNGVLAEPRSVASLMEALSIALCRSWDEEAIASEGGRTWDDAAEETKNFLSQFLP